MADWTGGDIVGAVSTVVFAVSTAVGVGAFFFAFLFFFDRGGIAM
jgi:hypothetical protein